MNQRIVPLLAVALILGTATLLAVIGAVEWSSADDSAQITRFDRAEFVASDARRPPKDNADWKTVKLPDEWRKRPDIEGKGWYRIKFSLDPAPAGLQGILVRYRRASTMAFYVNGKRIGGSREGQAESAGRARTGRESTFGLTIPPHLLHAGENVIHVQMSGTAHPAKLHGLGRVYFGDARSVRRFHIWLNEIGVNSKREATIMALAAGIITLFLWLARRRDRVMFWFSMACLVWGAAGIVYTKLRWEDMAQLGSFLYFAVAYGLVVPTIILALRTVNLKWPRIELALWLFFVFELSYPLWPTQPWPWALFAWDGVNTLLLLSTVGIVLWGAPRPLAWPIGLQVAALTAMAAFMSYEFVRFLGWGPVESPVLRHYHVPVMLLAMGAACFERHARTVRQIERTNTELEHRVAEKTREVAENHAQIEGATRERALTDERQRILADMHDGLGATLVSLLRHVRSGSASPNSVRRKAQEALQEMRAAIDALQPHGDDLGTVLGALRPRLDGLIAGSGLRLEWDVDTLPNVGELSASAVFSLQRIVLEAVANALKHSGATMIRFKAGTGENGNIEIRIEDDGCGFDQAQANTGLGIGNMRARAERIGATLNIESQSGSGTVVQIILTQPPQGDTGHAGFSWVPRAAETALFIAAMATGLLMGPWASPAEAAAAKVIEFEKAEFLYSEASHPPGDKTPWRSVDLPDQWRHHPGTTSAGWYRLRFDLEQAPRGTQQIVVRHRRSYDAAFFVNGKPIGTAADNQSLTGNRLSSGLGSPMRHIVPAHMLRTGDNVIHIRMEASANPALLHGLGRVYFGNAREVRRIYARFNETGFSAKREFMFMTLAAGLIALFMWLARRRDSVMFWFSITCISWGAFGVAYLFWRWSEWTAVSQLLLLYTSYGLVVPTVILSLRTVDLRLRRFEAGLWLFFSLELSYALWGERWPFLHLVWDAMNSGLLIMAIAILLHAAPRPMRWPMTLQLLALTVMAVVMSFGIVRYLGWVDVESLAIRHYHVPLMLAAMGALCFDRYARALRQAERATAILEQEVTAKITEIETNHARVVEARRERDLAEERQRILTDMHEGLGANLVSLIGKIDSGNTNMPEIERQVQGALQEMRVAINALQTQRADLATALGGLRERLDGMLSGSGVRLEWDVDELPPAREFNPAEVFSLQRIVLEAVANTLEHANANRLRFVARTGPDGDIEIRIEDNGHGFDPANVRAGPGLITMRERAKRLGAQLSVDAHPGGATVLRLIIPNATKPQIAETSSQHHAVENVASTALGPQTA